MYYPNTCLEKSCKVHMHLHPCGAIHQGLSKWAYDGYIQNTGLLEYAATNDLIVIFPLAEFIVWWEYYYPCFAFSVFFPDERHKEYLTN